MRPSWQSITALLVIPAFTIAIQLDCSHVRVDEQSFNLKKLGGPRTVHQILDEPPTLSNTTFTIDICDQLKKDKDAKKGEDCPLGTRVCAKEYDYSQTSKDPKGYLRRVIAIAGEYTTTSGRTLNPQYTRLKDNAAGSEGDEGVMIELHGGKYPDKRSGTPQKAIVKFLCDKSVTGNEGFKGQSVDADSLEYGAMGRRADDDDTPELPNPDEGKNLHFISYKREGDTDVLRLRWRTKFACEGAVDKAPSDDSDSAGWGFFTWFIIIVFLLAAAYIIFGSWLNYNRYGARGWDLIPHGDTIRDIPYIVKDWGSNVAGRLKGGDSRGGYSAV